jgi:long-subunit fatty acid transport protein
MKKTITFLCAGLLTLGLSAQNFGVGLDYMMLSGTMIENEAGEAVKNSDGEDVSASSAVLNLNYAYAINDDMSAVVSAGYGMGFGLVPMKASLSYGFSTSISANIGMGIYMISDDGYNPTGVEGEEGSANEAGFSAGIAYHMNDIGIGLGYEMIKSDGEISLNSFTIGLSYSFGGGSGDSATDSAPSGK